MATLRQRKDGRFFVDFVANGKRIRQDLSIDGRSVKDPLIARVFFEKFSEVHNRTNHPTTPKGPDSPTVARILDYYRDTYLVANNAAEATRAAAQTHCSAFLEWCRGQHIGRMQQINTEVMARYQVHLQESGRGARTATNYATTIRTAFNVAVDAELLDKSPVRTWTLPKIDAVEKHPLTLDELIEVMKIFHDRPIVLWMCLTGQRPSDARSLKFGDVDIPTRTVQRQSVKVRALRKFEICEEAALLVAREAQRPHVPGECVFRSSHGAPWSADGLLNSMMHRLKQVEHPRRITPRMLRDSFATILANDFAMPLPELQILMGHTDIKTTMQYVRARGGRTWLNALDTAVSRGIKAPDQPSKAPVKKSQ